MMPFALCIGHYLLIPISRSFTLLLTLPMKCEGTEEVLRLLNTILILQHFLLTGLVISLCLSLFNAVIGFKTKKYLNLEDLKINLEKELFKHKVLNESLSRRQGFLSLAH
uniref:p12 n=1 Tax=Raspberry bushy dwarf virus TaxID=12451 RepID=W8SI31_RBDV|nr:P12 [Raspberry bushy dwarf virus]WMP13086.1 RNA silencing suppressor [Raspberry bushy dwarf virus]